MQNSAQNPDRANSLEALLAHNGVKLAFNGHAHVYQRDVAPPGGVVSYVTGGGGAKLVAMAMGSVKNCSSTNAYALGWSEATGSGSYCAAAHRPTSPSQVYHFLKVTVSGTSVTVTPTNAEGHAFDRKTYNFGSDRTPPTIPGSAMARYSPSASPTISWRAAPDDGSGVAARDIYRQLPGGTSPAYLATVSSDRRAYVDSTAAWGIAYHYSVAARDQAGNVAIAGVLSGTTGG